MSSTPRHANTHEGFPCHLHTALLPHQKEQKSPFQRTLGGEAHSPESTSSCASWVSGKSGEGDEALKSESTNRGF